jgi:hypothetical protein
MQMPQRTPWKSDFHGISLKKYIKIWHTIWKGYNSHYEVHYVDRVIQELKAAFAWHHKFWNISQGNENQEYTSIQVMGMTR